MKLNDQVSVNRVGWHAIRHRDGWWVGHDQGVTCYWDKMFAQYALTILWQRDGGGRLNYRIETFTRADICTGEYTPTKTMDEALRDYESDGRS